MHDRRFGCLKGIKKGLQKVQWMYLEGGEISEVRGCGTRLEQASRSGVQKSQVLVGP